jgi:hypothetical protein
MKRLLCWLLGHRLVWTLQGTPAVLIPVCSRCHRHIASSDCGARAPL